MERALLVEKSSEAAPVQPIVSVLIPTYNVATYLERALDSALAQTLSSVEVIVVDESTDSTLEIAQAAAARDPRVRVIRNERRLGLAESRNRAQRAASGVWLALLDGDDAWLPDRLERLVAQGEASGADMVSDDLFWVERDQRTARCFLRQACPALVEGGTPHWLTSGDLLGYRLGFLKPIMRRAFIEGHAIVYNSALQLQEDLHYFLAALLAGARWLQLPEAGYLYFQRPGSAMTEWVDRAQESHLLETSDALLRNSAVLHDPVIRAEVERFVAGEHLAMQWGLLRNDVRQRRWPTFLRRLLAKPFAAPEVMAFGVRSSVLRMRAKRRPADLILLDTLVLP